MELLKDPKIDFLGKAPLFAAVSALIVIGSAVLVSTRGMLYGVEFSGGTQLVVQFTERPQLDKIRDAVTAVAPGATIQTFDEVSKNEVLIRIADVSAAPAEKVTLPAAELPAEEVAIPAAATEAPAEGTTAPAAGTELPAEGATAPAEGTEPPAEGATTSFAATEAPAEGAPAPATATAPPAEGATAPTAAPEAPAGEAAAGVPAEAAPNEEIGELARRALSALATEYPTNPVLGSSAEIVGPIVGAELRRKAIQLTVLALLFQLVYIGIRFKGPVWGSGAAIAVVHDVLVTLGVLNLTGYEITLNVIAALLTIVGYSVNDTIVIFDRARENLRQHRKAPFPQVVNESINQTLSRTLITSVTTFIAVLGLYLFGGEVLRGFAFTMLVGIVTGTYSTIYIATPIVVWWRGRGVKPATT
jgi:preprotein translocase subunit SecF